MALDAGTLQATLGMDTTDFSKGIESAKSGLAGLGASLKALMLNPAVLAVSAVAAVAAVGKAAFDASEKIETAYDYIRVGTGATGEALDDLKGDFNAVYGNFPADTDAVGTAIADLNTRLGLTGQPLQDLATQFLELSRITETDVGTNIQNITRVFTSWDIDEGNYSATMDGLFKVSQTTGIGIDELSTKIVQSGASLRSMGFSLEESAAMLGKFEKEGVNTETALASMKIALAKMAESGVTDTREAFRMLVDDIKTAPSATEAMSAAMGTFGSGAASDMTAAIREGRFEYEGLMKTIEESPETIASANADTVGFVERLQTLGQKATLAIAPLGNQIEKGLDSGFQGLNSLLDGVLPQITTFIMFVIGIVDKLKAPFERIFKRIGETFSKYWGESEDTTGSALDNIANIITTVVGGIADLIDWFFDTIYPAIDAFISYIVPLIKAFSAFLAGDTDEMWKQLEKAFKAGLNIIYRICEIGWNALMDGIEGAAQGIVDFIFGAMNSVISMYENAVNTIIGGANTLISGINSLTGADFDLIGTVEWQLETPDVPQLTRFENTGIGERMQTLMQSLDVSGETSEQPAKTVQITQNFNVPAVDSYEIEQAARRADAARVNDPRSY